MKPQYASPGRGYNKNISHGKRATYGRDSYGGYRVAGVGVKSPAKALGMKPAYGHYGKRSLSGPNKRYGNHPSYSKT